MAKTGIARRFWIGCACLFLLGAAVQPVSGLHHAAGMAPVPPPGNENPEKREVSSRSLPPGTLATGMQVVQPNSVSGILLREDFEGANPLADWQILDLSTDGEERYWAANDAQPRSGLMSAWPAAGGSDALDPGMYAYPANLDSWMVYGPVNFTSVTNARLEFSYTNQSETSVDFFGWYASVDGMNFQGERASGDSGEEWQQVTFDLASVPELGNLNGQETVWIAFAFTSDGNSEEFYEGAFVDDVFLKGTLASGTNLLPDTPAGWDHPVVPASQPGTTSTGTLYALQATYIDWAVLNEGDAIATPFRVCLYLDGSQINSWPVNAMSAGQTYSLLDYLPSTDIGDGEHTLMLRADCTNQIAEANEEDNTFSYAFTWEVAAKPNLAPFKYPGWSYPIVPTNAYNSFTYTQSLDSTKNTYIHWALRNTGSDITTTFKANFYIDDLLIPAASETISLSEDVPLEFGSFFPVRNRLLSSSPAPGNHVLKLVVDPDNVIDELDETDNTWQREFTWAGSCVSVTVSAEPETGGTAAVTEAPTCPEGRYILNTIIHLQAVPAANYAFIAWTGTDSSTSNPFAVKLVNDQSAFSAHFVRCYSLTLVSSPVSGGNVSGLPQPNCGNLYRDSTRVGLTAAPRRGYGFVGWQGPVETDPQGAFVIMDADKSVTGQFMTIPPTPVLVSPANKTSASSLKPTFRWKPSGANIHYELELAINPDFSSATRVSDLADSFYTPTDPLEPLQWYSWRVRAVNSSGLTSNWSSVRLLHTLAQPPVLVDPANGASLLTLRPLFQWEPLSGASKYTLQLSTAADFHTVFFSKTVTGNQYESSTDLRFRGMPLYWRVRGIVASRAGSWSDPWQFFTPNPPQVPVLLTPANTALVTDPTPMLDWKDVKTAVGLPLESYRLQVSTQPDFDEISIDQMTGLASEFQAQSDLAANTRWYWRVRAINDQEQLSAWSTVYLFRTALLPPNPAWPAEGEKLLNNRPVFDWPLVIGVSSYTLQISASPSFGTLLVNKTTRFPGPRLSADLPANTNLYWRARANGVNGPSLWSAVRSFQTGNPPGAPLLLLPAPNALVWDYQPLFTWKAARFPAGTQLRDYQIQTAIDAAFSNPMSDFITALEFRPALYALEANTRFYWRVRAYNQSGEYSNWSAPRTFRTALAAPRLLTPPDGASTTLSRPVFEWEAVEGAAGYTIQVSARDDFRPLKTSASFSARATSWTCNKTLSPGIYYWKMRAKGSNGPGNWSDVYFLQIME